MTDPNFYCSHCGQHLEAPPEMAGDQLPCPACDKLIEVPGSPTETPSKQSSVRGSLFGRILAGVVGGLIVAWLSATLFILFFGDPTANEQGIVVIVLSATLFICLWVGAIVLGIKAARPAKAWRHLLIPSGILTFIVPLATLVTAARMESDMDKAGGTFVAIVIGFFAVILGATFLIVGLLVGKETKKPSAA